VDLPEHSRGQQPLAPGGALDDRAVVTDVDQPVRVHCHLDLRTRVEAVLEHRWQRARGGQWAVGNRQHVVAPVRAQPGPALVVDSKPDAVAPAQRPTGQLLDRYRALDPGQPAELLGQDVGLQGTLRGRVGVLQVAAPAATRPRPAA
jgi:hypothetical protein